MPWQRPRPRDGLSDIETTRLWQEFYDRIRFGTFSWTPPAGSVTANSTVTFLLSANGPDIFSTVANGLRLGSPVIVSPPSFLPSQVSVYAYCDANDSARIAIVNPTAVAITPTAGTWGLAGIQV